VFFQSFICLLLQVKLACEAFPEAWHHRWNLFSLKEEAA